MYYMTNAALRRQFESLVYLPLLTVALHGAESVLSPDPLYGELLGSGVARQRE